MTAQNLALGVGSGRRSAKIVGGGTRQPTTAATVAILRSNSLCCPCPLTFVGTWTPNSSFPAQIALEVTNDR